MISDHLGSSRAISTHPYFVACKAERRSGCRKHPVHLMNVSRGVQRPPMLPHEACGDAAAAGQPRCGAVELPTIYINEGVTGRTSGPQAKEVREDPIVAAMRNKIQ